MKGFKYVFSIGFMLLGAACNHGAGSYSILADSKSFQQSSGATDTKIDVLWVIDNSGSMATSQRNLTDNFGAFINKISTAGYDFQIGVTTTQAYLANPIWTPFYNSIPMPSYFEGLPQDMIAAFRDGVAGGAHSGFPILKPNTPDLQAKFIINATQGVNGNGDERTLESLQAALSSVHNTGFVRSNSFLAVIILTDEDDFSNGTTRHTEIYDNRLTPVSSFVTFLDGLTGSTDKARHYNVSTIAVPDQTCLDQIFNGAQKIGLRVNELAELTGGIKGNICGDFANELDLISQEIVKLSTQFYLGNAEPIPESIKIWVNGVQVPNKDSNPAGNGGWQYVAGTNSIMFSGEWVPPQGANIQVAFDPVKVTF